MITLITGTPGTGKTALALSLILPIAADRPFYCAGVDDLTLDHEPIDPFLWHDEVQDGAIVLIDECQKVFRPGNASASVPQCIAELETHRHRGIDFFLVTQGPHLVHANVRALVGRHIHLRDLGFLAGRRWYEWPNCHDTVRTSVASATITKRYNIDKKVFQYYKSAEHHFRLVRGNVKGFGVLFFGIIALLVAGVYSYHRYSERTKNTDLSHFSAKNDSGTPALPGLPSLNVAQGVRPPPTFADFIPVEYDRPWTARAYDHLRVVVSMPRIVGALCVDGVCQCYTQQDTQAEVSDEGCAAWVERKPFDPYRNTEALEADGSGGGRIFGADVAPSGGA